MSHTHVTLVSPSTEDELRRRLQLVCNTLAGGEANEKACHEAIDFLTKRLVEIAHRGMPL